ncbi:antibiotic resistance protein VanZ [Haloferax sp. MBLA0076]|uniref:Antibiotic resistance protein VanZ n=1 Tax=Haloferax litoreum TaxID=2666140 RepID=A0A6A8GCL2_9EURY|nr:MULTISPECIES: VanZ family protein [Haloferax]KAB1192446.1 VanZ family protein [Haloferax sp. CBA1148]MRX20913.1 antibiotic resistance protein VanZ [Haloferax litoreum]
MTLTTRLRDNPRATLVVLGYALVVLVASVVPTPPGGLTPSGPLGLVGLDKWVHGVGYAVLGFGLALASRAQRGTEIGHVIVVASAYGAGIELVQATLPYRSFSIADAGANVLGAVLGGLLWYISNRLQTGR